MIYLVEDDENIRKLVSYTLKSMGMEVAGFEAPSAFYAAMEESMPELVLLDVMLPEESGLDILKKLRRHENTKRLPIIMLTARTSEYDRVLGLDSGADDYIAKPFSIMELVARIKAVLRRSQPEEHPDFELQHKNLWVSLENHMVRVAGQEVILTLKEFETLVCLLQAKGRVVTREQLLTSIWGYDFEGTSRTIDTHIRTLRRKLGAAGDYIKTVRGVGYQMERDSEK